MCCTHTTPAGRRGDAMYVFALLLLVAGVAGEECASINEGGYKYVWCAKESVRQYHSSVPVLLGVYEKELRDGEVFSKGDPCGAARRSTLVRFKCCPDICTDDARYVFESITEPKPCLYEAVICDSTMCSKPKSGSGSLSKREIRELREEVRDMFYHAYNSYMENAYPAAELRPVSCRGGDFSFSDIPALTLIDTLDTLAVLGDVQGFQRGVDAITTVLADFDFDLNVSVFETTIRVLGGLLSAHIFASTPKYGFADTDSWQYSGRLLTLATDLADRLSAAFPNDQGIPYGTVNLRHGVPEGETPIASVAGAGSLSVEFFVASVLTGDPKYAKIATRASRLLFDSRSSIGLVGKHINAKTFEWTETASGIGTNADSFYEYLFKMYMLAGSEESWDMFEETYEAVMAFISDGDWYPDVHMKTGELQRQRVEGLLAFWPGLQTLIGDHESAANTMNALMFIWRSANFLPEGYEYKNRQVGANAVDQSYLLRPEFIESLVYLRKATNDDSWLRAGKDVLESIQTFCRTPCGYSSVSSLREGYITKQDLMPSFFLSETVKYLYLLFDDALTPEGHWVLSRDSPWVFSTEAHPYPVKEMMKLMTPEIRDVLPGMVQTDRPLSLLECPAEQLWVRSYDPHYVPNDGLLQPAPQQAIRFKSLEELADFI
eukprot:TRINITY_DN14768_c0_g1_i1.p1 TRINITY_DN14768_c0_g1~~TRINITY_DN14768_c0_g1_i1.p1  ORF type:complete len:662 (+),score=191.04 TRINITY_DN14768_c0_g1_i1:1111-3096(+)